VVQCMHNREVIHGDLKSGNFMITAADEIKVRSASGMSVMNRSASPWGPQKVS
jgi:tRNA A-37 threonylcarbamoyl transferase component Bud32